MARKGLKIYTVRRRGRATTKPHDTGLLTHGDFLASSIKVGDETFYFATADLSAGTATYSDTKPVAL